MQVKNNETKDGNLKKIKIEGGLDENFNKNDLFNFDFSKIKFKVKEVDFFDSEEKLLKTVFFGKNENQILDEPKSENHQILLKDELILGLSEIDSYINDVGNLIFY